MLTPGFRLFFGFAAAGLIAAVLYGVASGGTDPNAGVDYLGFIDSEAWLGALSLGWKGGVGDHIGYLVLVLFAATSAFLGLTLVAYRDADPEAVAQLNGGELPPSQRPTVASYWPMIAAFGAGVVILGLVLHAAIFVAGLLVLAIAGFEWMMSAWADRATGDPAANVELRNRIMKPIEVPVIGALGVGAVALGLSRVLLAVSRSAAIWVAVGVMVVIFAVAVLLATAPAVSKNLVAAVIVLGGVALLAGGVTAAAIGEREFHHGGEEEEGGGHSEEGGGFAVTGGIR
jgi:hypothetical protein